MDELNTMFEQAVEETVEEPAAEEPKPEQTKEERARQAEGRRIREREDRAYKAGIEAERKDTDELLKLLGIDNPQTGKTIESKEELKEYYKNLSDKRLESGKATREDLQRVVREVIETQDTKDGDKLTEAEMAQIRAQIAQLQAMDPAVKNIQDILDSEYGEKFSEYVDKGLDFVDAYSLAARDRLQKINSNRTSVKTGGKDHLSATTQRGEGALSVPNDELALFRQLNPGVSDADIQKYYNTDRQRFGK